MPSFSKFLALSLSASTVLADLSTKIDVITFEKFLKFNKQDDTMIVHFKKAYGYDSKDITEKINIGTHGNGGVTVFDVELPESLAKSDEEDSDSSPDTAEAAVNSESAESDENGMGGEEGEEMDPDTQAHKSEHKVKEAKTKKIAKALVDKMKIDVTKMPYLGIFKNGKQTQSMKIEEETEFDNVVDWLQEQNIAIQSSDIFLQEFDEIITKFATNLHKKVAADEFKSVMTDAEAAVADSDMETDETKDKMKGYLKTLKTILKHDSNMMGYIEKEVKRVSGMLKTNALKATKKEEMNIKVQCLKAITQKVNNLSLGAKPEL